MTRHLTTSICTCALSLAGSMALAHEGHGHAPGQGYTPTHYLTEPLHLLQFGAIALAVFVVGWLGLKRYFSATGQKKTSQ